MDFFSSEKNSTRKRGQGAFEYILMLGGTLLVVLVVTLTLRGQLGGAGQTVNQSTGTANTLTCLPTDMGKGTNGLVASWHFSEGGAATTTADSSGNTLTGTRPAGGTSWAAGKYGNALSADGTPSYVATVSSNALLDSNAFTLEGWFNFNDLSTYRPIFYREWYQNTGYRIGLWNGAVRFWATESVPQPAAPGTLDFSSSGVAFATGRWYHIAVTYNNPQAYIYVDGVQRGGATGNIIVPIGRPFWIGGIGGYFPNEIVDEVKVYSRALSQSEILADMACSLPG